MPSGLVRLDTPAGALELPGVQANIGETVRLHILASDVIIAKDRPDGLSARNILPVTIADIQRGRGPGAAVVLQAGLARLLSRITVASLEELGLQPGQTCFAILKANAVARSAIGT
jgi:molybdate transport system ATP-binding protein